MHILEKHLTYMLSKRYKDDLLTKQIVVNYLILPDGLIKLMIYVNSILKNNVTVKLNEFDLLNIFTFNELYEECRHDNIKIQMQLDL